MLFGLHGKSELKVIKSIKRQLAHSSEEKTGGGVGGGGKETKQNMRLWLSNLGADVQLFVKTCAVCRRTRSSSSLASLARGESV